MRRPGNGKTHLATTRRALVAGLIVTIASAACAFSSPVLLARVPFEFRAGTTHFGPGEYILEFGRVAGSLSIRTTDGARGTDLPVRKSRAAGGPTTPTVSFRAYGDHRFLSAIQAGV